MTDIKQEDIEEEYALHLKHLEIDIGGDEDNQATCPIVPALLREQVGQYGLIAGRSDILANRDDKRDPRLFYNIAAPFRFWKVSHFVMLSGELSYEHKHEQSEDPLSAILFHYDGFIGDIKGTPCEAAYLASNPNIKVRVLCSPTNISTITRTYSGMNVRVEPLRIDETDLTTQRMLSLMAVKTKGEMPLYLHSISRVLRDLRISHQATGRPFHYGGFKEEIKQLKFTPDQQGPLTLRLDTLESFMPAHQRKAGSPFPTKRGTGTDWSIKAGQLTIVDLSCPCITAEAASSLFNICLSLFLEEKSDIGKIVALDEAHKYMSDGTGDALTNSLLSTIRLQRHLGTRVIISTQEPTISPALIDLCSMTIVHRFSSPEWLKCLLSHVAALKNLRSHSEEGRVFEEIVKLRVGEALLFAPEAIIGIGSGPGGMRSRSLPDNSPAKVSTSFIQLVMGNGKKNEFEIHDDNDEQSLRKLGTDYIKMNVRKRLTNDGGKSILAA